MAKITKNSKRKSCKENEKYNADNEIIIGVTTRPAKNVRVDNKATRTNKKNSQKKANKKNNNYNKVHKSTKNNVSKKNRIKKERKNEYAKDIKKINNRRKIISIIILILIILGGTIYLLTTPAFNINDIKVFGNNKNSVDTYKSLSKINIGNTNIFAFTNNSVRKNIKENPYVEDVEIKRKLPNTLELHITERKVSYQIEYADKYIYINDQGYILEINQEAKDVPTIKGLSFVKENIELGKRVNNEDLGRLETIFKIINYCKYNNIQSKISSINVSDDKNYILYFEADKKTVYIGDASTLSERILWLKTILEKEKGNEGEIFINGDLNRDKVYFREKK